MRGRRARVAHHGAMRTLEPLWSKPILEGLRDLVRPPAFMRDAAALCPGGTQPATPDVDFFPERGQDARAAQAVCARCPVSDECLEYALEKKIKDGIWGGKSGRDRRRLRARARRDDRLARAG
jgi:WhiB family redox-sensing transcriptional regulator